VGLVAFHRRLALQGPSNFWQWLLFALLLPLGLIYGILGLIRVFFYRQGVLPVYRASVPVVSVGNLAAGGTGKTPFVDSLLKVCRERGIRVAVVSRGYGGTGVTGVAVVCSGEGPLLDPAVCGDEPYLLARRNPRALILVARKRALGVALAVERFGAELIILDDGFQHLGVARDLDIVLLDARAPVGNGWPLPAGLLREFPSALGRGDLFILTRTAEVLPSPDLPGPRLHARHRLGAEAVALGGGERRPLTALQGQRGVAFAGIADPEAFFAGLRGEGLELLHTLSFADHAGYGSEELRTIGEAGLGADYLITTEKDGVKLAGQSFFVPCYEVPLILEFVEEGGVDRVMEMLIEKGGNHGHLRRTP
jgi:tetraacyldisaccharide 4'-kinase